MLTETYSTLSRNQKEAACLLSIGTFLEYFDFMLYVHMSVLLNELFFPATDINTANILQAFTFCITFIFRPIGALFFGWVGDNISRKSTVIITTTMMSLSCIIMANLPTYSQIGILASWLITLCRIFQGLSSMGEIIGAELYLTEFTKPPAQYPIVGFVVVASKLGAVAALGIATLVTYYDLNWRLAFWVGAMIAIVGAIARTALRETPEFANAKNRLKSKYKLVKDIVSMPTNDPIVQSRINKKTVFFVFMIYCEWPLTFYFVYMYCANVLKNSFGFSPNSIIYHNFIIGVIQFMIVLLINFISYKIHPLKIIKTKLKVFLTFILFIPFLLYESTSYHHIFLIQIFFILFTGITFPASPVFYRHMPIFKRFTYGSFMYALSRALIYIISSFGVVCLTKYLGHYGFLIIMLPIYLICYLGIKHFEILEEQSGNYTLAQKKRLDPNVLPVEY